MYKKPKLMRTICLAVLMAASALAGAAEPKKLAFVDTGNTGRSVSAEALANVIIGKTGEKVAVISRAVDIDPYDIKPEVNAATLLQQRGIDVTAHRSVQITTNDVKHSDVILTMTEKHKSKLIELFPDAKNKTFTLAEYSTGKHVDVPDAWGKPIEVYVEMIKQLDAFIHAALEKIVETPI